jgi:hypothetical protein
MASSVPDVGVLSVYAGDTFTQTFEFFDDDEPVDFVADGWDDWVAQYRINPKATNFVAFTVDVSDADEGRITLSLSATQTRNLPGEGVFDLQATENNVIRTWLKGRIAVSQDVTRV